MLHHDTDFGFELNASRPNFKQGLCSYTPNVPCALEVLSARRETLRARAQKRPLSTNASCAVVGSSRVGLASRYGTEIDAHDEVIRINYAVPKHRQHAFVGNRTTVRLYGVYPDKHVDDAGRTTTVLYCPPVIWVGKCWNFVNNDAHLRLSSRAWEEVNHEVRPRSLKSRQHPSSGAMAVFFALTQCKHVRVYAMGSAIERCQKYSTSCRFKTDYSLNDYHDFEKEWQWYCRLHDTKQIWLSTYEYMCTRR